MQALLTSPLPPFKSDSNTATSVAQGLRGHIDAGLAKPARDACDAAVAAAGEGAVAGIAAINGPSQVVLSGDENTVAAAAATLRASKFARRAVPLQVSCPFHCDVMAPAAAVLRPVMTALLGAPRLPSDTGATAGITASGSGSLPALQAEALAAIKALRDRASSSSSALPLLTLPDSADSKAAIWAEVSWLVERLFEAGAAPDDAASASARRKLRCPIITNADAGLHHDAADAGLQLVEGITKPVLWYSCSVQALTHGAAAAKAAASSSEVAAAQIGLRSLVQDEQAVAAGAAARVDGAALTVVEFGPGNTLTTLVKQIAAAHPQLLQYADAPNAANNAKSIELRLASVGTPADVRAALPLLA